MTRRSAIALGLTLAALTATACSSGAGAQRAPDRPRLAVAIKGFLFSPASLDVTAGETVTWTNDDDIAHTVTSGTPEAPNGAFDSGDRTLRQSFMRTFVDAGTFTYFCNNHKGMRGVVHVARREGGS